MKGWRSAALIGTLLSLAAMQGCDSGAPVQRDDSQSQEPPPATPPPVTPPAATGAPSPLVPNGVYDGPNGEVLRFDGTNFVDAATGAPRYRADGTPIGAN